jgi:anti-sigma regulatory factor (Ser/Thr protein kinase)
MSAMGEIANVRLRLSNAAESVAVVQQALGGLAAELGLDALEANDVNTAVTEVCNNVVLHAYEGTRGPLEVAVRVLAGALEVAVSDRGIGIRPHLGERTQPHTGLGMPIVHALTQRLVFSKRDGGGTEVRMLFTTPEVLAPAALAGDELESRTAGEGEDERTIAIALGPSAIARAVLPRVLGALARRVELSGEGIAAIQPLADALAATAGDWLDASQLGLTVELAPHELRLHVGPLRTGGATALLAATVAVDGAGLLIERLPDDPDGACGDAEELLALRLLDRG